MNKIPCFIFSCLFSFSTTLLAEQKEIAITIDDLPFVGTTHNKPGNLRREQERFLNIMNALLAKKVPATGFVISGTIEQGQWQLLQQFHDEGFTIGNHTYSHPSLNRMSADAYIKNIDHADKTLTPLMTDKKYFRYPYLAESHGEKKEKVHEYLKEKHYTIAPVTIDPKDFAYNEQLMHIYWRKRPQYLNGITQRYLSYMWRQTERAEKRSEKKYGREMPQILLIHANYLNSHAMGDIIDMYQKKGYRFISLGEAIQAYQIADKKGADTTKTAEKPSQINKTSS